MWESGRGKNKEAELLLQPSKSLLSPAPPNWSILELRGPGDKDESIFIYKTKFLKILSLNTIPNPVQLSMPFVAQYWPWAPNHFPSKISGVLPGKYYSPSGRPLPDKYFFSLSLFPSSSHPVLLLPSTTHLQNSSPLFDGIGISYVVKHTTWSFLPNGFPVSKRNSELTFTFSLSWCEPRFESLETQQIECL